MVTYLKGDATNPVGIGPRIIAHICNDAGRWGAGFVLALSKRDPMPEWCYKHWFDQRAPFNQPFGGGEIQVVSYDPANQRQVSVCNMIAQHGTSWRSVNGNPDMIPPIRYDWLESALRKLNSSNTSIHMPRIGCGLAGGKWEIVERIIKDTLTLPVFIYDL